MDTKDLIIYDHTKGEEIEHVREIMPDVRIAIFSVAFRIEAVRLGDTSRFVIATYEMNALGIAELETDEERDRLD